MVEENNDILVDISEDQLPKLANLYEHRAPWAPWMVGLVQTGMKLMKSKYRNYVTFMSPNNCWEEDGTIIATMTYCRQDIFVFTVDDKCINLDKGLNETKRLKYDNQITQILAVHEKHVSTVKKILEKEKIQVTEEVPNYIYVIPPNEAKNFSIECFPNIYIKKLQPQAAKQVNDLWPHTFFQSEKYIASYIEINGGYGVFLKSNDEMVAWIVKHVYGHLGMLQVKKKYRRRGYASLVTKVLSKEIGEEGRWSMGTIIVDNDKSVRMFEKLGFRKMGKCTFFTIK